jgi:hypothetical protein
MLTSGTHHRGRRSVLVMVGLDPTNAGNQGRIQTVRLFAGVPMAPGGRVRPDHDGCVERNGKMRTAAC